MQFTLEELAKLTDSKLVGNPKHIISDVADLQSAQQTDASFLANPRYEQAMRKSQAGVIFIDPSVKIESGNFLINANPSQAFQKVIDALHGNVEEFTGFTGIHPSAVIHETAKIGNNVSIGPCSVIDKNVTIGDNAQIGAHCYIGPSTTIGSDCLLHARVTIRERCTIGNRVILQPGVVIGSCGFGYITDKTGKHSKLNQVGTVTLEDDVEIGANTTIDRARFKTTRIQKGTKIDNLVQIGHGVVVGEDNIIVSQSGIAGSTTTGKNVVLGGQTAIAGHIQLGNQVMVAACSGVSKSLPDGGKYGGIPAVPLNEYNRNAVYLRNIETFIKELKEMQKQIAELNQ